MPPAEHPWRRRLQIGLVVLGSLNMVGFATGLGPLRGLAIASVASPLPFVFSQFRDYETFAADYTVEVEFSDGGRQRVAITPALYSKLGGTYNRRNTYGAAASYGPRMNRTEEQALVTQVLTYGLCHGGPLAQTLPRSDFRRATFIVRSRTAGSDERWEKTLDCGDHAP